MNQSLPLNIIQYINKNILSYRVVILFLLIPLKSYSQVINTHQSGRNAILGSAYDSNKEVFIGQNCVEGLEINVGQPKSTFSFQQTLSEEQLSKELGLAVGGRARYGVVEVSAAADFYKKAVSSSFSASAVWLSSYILPSKKLVNIMKSSIGNTVNNNFEQWKNTCGNKFVDEISYGAKLFFSIRIDFKSKEEKERFEANFSLSGPLYSANASLSQASREFSRNVTITISAFQIGGDVSKLTALFGNSREDRISFVQCTLGDFEKCSNIVQAAITYASDIKNGFPSQLNTNSGIAAPLSYTLSDYQAAGIYNEPPPFLDRIVIQSRKELERIFENQFKLLILSERFLSLGLPETKKTEIATEDKKIRTNIKKIIESSEICYEIPSQCPQALERLKDDLININETIFVLPPLPIGEYRLFSNSKKVWQREESLEMINDTIVETTRGNRRFPERRTYKRLKNELDIADELREDISVVLYIKGTALKEAIVYFENKELKRIPLVRQQNSFSDKFGNDYRLIVVGSTRSHQDWIDVNTNILREQLRNKDLPQAEGTFYLLVVDEFGRQSRFDIDYQKWLPKVTDNWTVLGNVYCSIRYNWWDNESNGTNAGITNKYSRFSNITYGID